jgi:CO/xanthine dehydrogenase FAD-binding subunit
MKIPCVEYLVAQSVREALSALSEAGHAPCIVSGGSDLLLDLQQGNHPPVGTLIDVTEIDEMRALEIRQHSLFIGASVTLTRLSDSALIKQHAQALSNAASLMANPQVCNVATIGGNVVHALPAADGTIALLALDAQAEIANLYGRRRVPIQTLFKGPGETTLDPCCELLVGFYLPLIEPGEASAFSRRVNPQGIALAMLNMAIWLKRDGERVGDIRIAIGPSGPVPCRMKAAEGVLRGYRISNQIRTQALEAVLGEARFRTSPHRATAEYRRNLAGVLWAEAFDMAWGRAGGINQA